MPKKVGWGIVGLGSIAGHAHLPAISESDNSELIAVCSRSESKAKEWARRFGAKRAYSDYLEMIKNPEIDVIDITTPNSLHCEETVLAAEEGKHVFCEKPMAPTVKECEKMIAACKRNNAKLMIGYMLRFKPHHTRIKEMLETGELGTPFLGRAQYHEWVPDEEETYLKSTELSGENPPLQDVGVHCIDTLRFLMGEVIEVMAYSDRIIHRYPADTVSSLLLKLERSAYAFVDSSFCTRFAQRPQKLEIYGTKGSVFAATLGSGPGGKLETLTADGARSYEIPEENHYLKEITHFSDCIIRGMQPAVSGEEGLKTQKVVAAAIESQRKGVKVRVSGVY
ncbi:MAG: Gfo/Idh/MocA family oxidoreductase [Candidatus Bathyarchaeota archaeon]|nr:Gfo/Idh/MocA family oxidoreductase [Candidatus Bathyarchaeota archaeon]